MRVKAGGNLYNPLAGTQIRASTLMKSVPFRRSSWAKRKLFLRSSIAELAEVQNVKPLADPSVLAGGIPNDQDVDEFLGEISQHKKVGRHLYRPNPTEFVLLDTDVFSYLMKPADTRGPIYRPHVTGRSYVVPFVTVRVLVVACKAKSPAARVLI